MRYLAFWMAILCGLSVGYGHGVAHKHHSSDAVELVTQEVIDSSEPELVEVAKKEKLWEAGFTTGWESRHIHFGVNETGDSGIYFNEVGFEIWNFELGVWNGFGVGNTFNEWDFTVSYSFETDYFFVLPGYNFRYMPGHVEAGLEHDHDHEEAPHDEHEHGVYGHEFFLSAGTTVIPYVVPSVMGIWDVNHRPGALVEARLDGDIPAGKSPVRFQPYVLLAYNLGYNSDTFGWNNFQTGVQCTCKINRWVSAFAGVNWSMPLCVLDTEERNEALWVNVGLQFSY